MCIRDSQGEGRERRRRFTKSSVIPIILAWRVHQREALSGFDPYSMVMGAATNLILHGPATACAIAADIRDCQIELVIAIGITDSDCPKSNSIASVLMAAWGMSKDKKEPFAWSNASW